MRAKRSNKKPAITAYNSHHRPIRQQGRHFSKRFIVHSTLLSCGMAYKLDFRESISKKITKC
jgi:hypothetical protein